METVQSPRGARNVYAGTFLIAFATLGLEISLTRLLSVTTWYSLAFFAISTAMLGLTAGAVTVYLMPDRFGPGRLERSLSRACLGFAIATFVSLVMLCLLPMDLTATSMGVLSLLIGTMFCSLPFYFSGIAIAGVLTRSSLPIGKVYAVDLVGAASGCLGVLAGVAFLDVPSLILLFGALGAAAGYGFAGREPATPHGRDAGLVLASLLALAAVNGVGYAGIAPVFVKGKLENRADHIYEKWNSFSRVAVHRARLSEPQMWGASPAMPPQEPLVQHHLNIDGGAGTDIRSPSSAEDLSHLAYDVTNVAYHLRPTGGACVIGVGAGRDVQSAIAAGHSRVLGIEVNPVFIELLEGPFREFAGIADDPRVRLVADEARSHLSRSDETFSVVQMSLIDTWAATGAGAFSLTENALYTVDAWRVFLDRLGDDGLLTVSRWHNPDDLGETGRIATLAVASLLDDGAEEPARHIAMLTSGITATTIVSRRPFSDSDAARLRELAAALRFPLIVAPDAPPDHDGLRRIVSAHSHADLREAVADAPLNLEPPTDERPYFFNMLRLRGLARAFEAGPGVVSGNLRATITLLVLLLCLALFAVVTVVVPLLANDRRGGGRASPILWSGAAYFCLLGAGFMLVEIALIQRLSVFLGHPVYALGILLFTIIASTGVGSFLSERLPLTRGRWPYALPLAGVAAVLIVSWTVPLMMEALVAAPMGVKIAWTVAALTPLGVVLGMFFPCGMRLAREGDAADTPWYWALNGIFGVLCSVVAVFVSIHFGISKNLMIGAACYGLLVPCVRGMVAARTVRPSTSTEIPPARASAG